MTSTDKELKRRQNRHLPNWPDDCPYGHGYGEPDCSKCPGCGYQNLAYWALFDPSIKSPMAWDDELGEFVYRERRSDPGRPDKGSSPA